jgi:Putative abortive phage resistance protein AbiGi, antitoxin
MAENQQEDQSTNVNISSKTLFHFTESIDNLKNILVRGFYPHLCLETFQIGDGNKTDICIPMTSFCDLPLFLIKNHLNFYGPYGIGMSKSWGIEKGISPVTYFHKNSPIKTALGKISDQTIETADPKTHAFNHHLMHAEDIISNFLKEHEGYIWRARLNDYIWRIFYNEREWRFVPDLVGDKQIHIFLKEWCKDEDKKSMKVKIEEELSQKYTLNLSPNDIQYIIVKNDEEVLDMIEAIDRIFDKEDPNTRNLLKTCLATVDFLEED